MSEGVFYLDTCFLFCLLKENDPLHQSALDHFTHLLSQKAVLKVSTIALAEYCVKEDLGTLPLRNLQVVSFTPRHVAQAGKLMRCVYEERHKQGAVNADTPRYVVTNDVKMIAQMACEKTLCGWLTADTKFGPTFDCLKNNQLIEGRFVDIHKTCQENFNLLFP